MGTWGSRGLRGSTLEDFINRTNEKYLSQGVALIQKIPTPITPVKIDKEHRHITLAYFDQQSTVDYMLAYMSYYFKNYEVASKYLASVIQSAAASRKMKELALELKELIMAELRKK